MLLTSSLHLPDGPTSGLGKLRGASGSCSEQPLRSLARHLLDDISQIFKISLNAAEAEHVSGTHELNRPPPRADQDLDRDAMQHRPTIRPADFRALVDIR